MSKKTNSFIQLESLSGILLILMLACALILANSPLWDYYEKLQELPIGFTLGTITYNQPLLLWVNKGLMSLFFLLLTLEIKREIFTGGLSTLSRVTLPISAAIGGIICPIIIFLFFNKNHADYVQGWPIVTTTDIAFMLGILTLLRNRVAHSMKVIIVALSIIDDIFAVILLAVYYTDTLSFWAFLLGGSTVFLLFLLNWYRVDSLVPYSLLGIFLWCFMVQSGIHATLAGVILAAFIPFHSKDKQFSPLKDLEDKLHPWVAFCILPLFVLFNGGVSLGETSFTKLAHPLYLGIGLGLCLGKVIGVFFFSVIILKLKWATLPKEISYRQLLGCSALTGIGFTMSLFFTGLAFTNLESNIDNIARQAVLLGSLLSVILGVCILLTSPRIKKNDRM